MQNFNEHNGVEPEKLQPAEIETTDGRVRVLTEDKEQFSTCISPIKRAFKPQPSP